MSPITAEYRPMSACLTQNKTKRANKIVFLLLIRDQEVDGSNPFAPTISFRTNNLQTYGEVKTAWRRTRRSMVQIEPLRLCYFRFSHRLTLRFRDVRNTWKLSNLSNTCLTTSPTDKESGFRRSGVDAEFYWRSKTLGVK